MQGLYKLGEVVNVTYQAIKNSTGLTDVVMKVYDETRAYVSAMDVTMTEIAATGIYYGSFTPDAEGVWTVKVDSIIKPGPVIKDFMVTGHNIDSIGDAIAALNDLSTSEVNTVVLSALSVYGVATTGDISGEPMIG